MKYPTLRPVEHDSVVERRSGRKNPDDWPIDRINYESGNQPRLFVVKVKTEKELPLARRADGRQ